MKFHAKAALLLTTFLVVSCSSFTPTIDNETLVKLERTACYGTCPIYTVTVRKNGVVEYNGIKHVSVKGFQTTTVPSRSIELIEAELIKTKFMRMRSRLDTGSLGCFVYATDHSRILIEASIQNRKKAVLTYLGCDSNQVKSVIGLASYIDKIVGTLKWVDAENEP